MDHRSHACTDELSEQMKSMKLGVPGLTQVVRKMRMSTRSVMDMTNASLPHRNGRCGGDNVQSMKRPRSELSPDMQTVSK